MLSRFSDYIRGMADGRVTTTQGAVEAASGGFAFPLREAREDADGVAYAFAGLVRFGGHAGMLDLPIGEVEVGIRDGACRLEIADPDDAGVRVLFATGEAVDEGESIALTLKLEEDGSELFFYRYPAGFDLDPARIWLTDETSSAT